jgi:hypothetical protein
MMHVSDWFVTLAGLAGADPSATGPRPPDGHDMWPALCGANETSPRVETILAVTNRHFNASLGDVGVQACTVSCTHRMSCL